MIKNNTVKQDKQHRWEKVFKSSTQQQIIFLCIYREKQKKSGFECLLLKITFLCVNSRLEKINDSRKLFWQLNNHYF